jgi:hypothetical protein
MSPLHKNIEEQARALSAEDQAKLAESMLESLHTSITEIESALDILREGDLERST